MDDVNVILLTVDRAMDIMDGVEKNVCELESCVVNELRGVLGELENQSRQRNNYFDRYYSYDDYVFSATSRGDDLENEFRRLCDKVIELTGMSKRIMGTYIRKLNLIGNHGSNQVLASNNSGIKYFIVVINSERYPQTAAHITRALEKGLPEIVTLDRGGAADRRKESLKNVNAVSLYDRDEWPMAIFKEGGSGADVEYVEAKDNRGAGSSLGWQMKSFQDGSRVRIRVI